MFKRTALVISACAISATLVFSAPPNHANLSTLVVMGDSLSAGVQNFSLLYTEQKNGFASLIAAQANTPLPLPLVPYPGAPNVLELVGPPPDIQAVPGTLTSPRLNPTQQPLNISIPGITVADSLTMFPTTDPTAPAVQQWATIVLGFPAFVEGQPPKTQLETAVALKPTTIIEWLGNNDALVPALVGQLAGLTPVNQFAASYQQVLDTLASTGASIVTANIPDVTEVPYFTSVQSIIAGACGKTIALTCAAGVTKALGVGAGDYLRLSGIALANDILSHQMAGPLPQYCPSPLAALSTSPIPCVLTAADATTLRAFILAYNIVIEIESALHGAVMVDIHSLVAQISAQGYNVGGKTLTTAFLGGLFSLDGIHPTNTGYAIIANTFINRMNAQYNTKISRVDIQTIAATDPLIF